MTFFDKNKFNMACNETIEIIMHMEDEMKEKIPQKLITFLNKNKIRDYKPSIDFSKNILEQDLLFETKSIIAVIYREYIATPNKKKELIEWDKKNELKIEEEKRKKYNPDKIFKSDEKKEKIESKVAMTVYKESVFRKFINKIKNINDVLKNTEIQLKNVEKEDFTTIEKLQINAIKKGIYDKFMLEKSEIDRAKFKKKFDKIQNRGAIAKALDVFLEREDIVDMKKENMFFAIKEIDETRNNIDETEEPKKEYKIIEILAEIEIFLRENYNGRNKRKLSQIYKIRDNIYSVFSIDSKELKNEIIEKQKSRLPVKINKRIIGVRKEREKIITFLNQNGYVLKDENITFNSNLQNIIKKINLISKAINTETKMNFKNIN